MHCCLVMDVSCIPPGYMAPGSACDVSVTFKPRTNEDLFTIIPCLAESGPFEIPVQCLIKRAILTLEPSYLDFDGKGGVLLAESATQSITITNDGALDANYVIVADETATARPPAPDADGEQAPDSGESPASASPALTARSGKADEEVSTALETQGFIIPDAKGVVPGYGRIALPVTFAPSVSGFVRVALKVVYIAPKDPEAVLSPENLILLATGREMPVFTKEPSLDFSCCMFDHTYKHSLVLHNSGKTTMKAAVLTREGLGDYVEFAPEFGYVQVRGVRRRPCMAACLLHPSIGTRTGTVQLSKLYY